MAVSYTHLDVYKRQAVGYRTESLHGAGSPQAQRIMISRQSNLEAKKQLVKDILDIDI